ncbi:unnamed protein product [Chironomus riparius]|uniref:Uncharacterized protein n=1 Tax=Chironomus riparius TaxID=315576 RepID=A0A9N9RZ09_9DIPT|nr:unnamed protein product [Chironomus riparius]
MTEKFSSENILLEMKQAFLITVRGQVGNEPTMYHPTADNNLFWSSKNLLIQILPSHYQNGHLILRCTAEVGTFYADYTEAFLETTRKEPIPERGMCII